MRTIKLIKLIMVIHRDQWKRDLCLYLMFQTHDITATSRRYFSYSDLARALGLTPGKVYHICTTAHLKSTKKKDSVRKLNQTHIAFLLSPQTLNCWAGLTMKERVILFHR